MTGNNWFGVTVILVVIHHVITTRHQSNVLFPTWKQHVIFLGIQERWRVNIPGNYAPCTGPCLRERVSEGLAGVLRAGDSALLYYRSHPERYNYLYYFTIHLNEILILRGTPQRYTSALRAADIRDTRRQILSFYFLEGVKGNCLLEACL